MEQNALERALHVDGWVDWNGDMISVRTSSPQPPGSRVRFVLSERTLHGKVTSIRKSAAGGLELSIRLHSMVSADRQYLEQLWQSRTD